MRLIDADALILESYDKCVEECACCKESVGMIHYVRGHKFKTHDRCGLIVNAPTIDAIPVTWIQKHMNEPIMAQGIHALLYMWRKEQEANSDD